MTILSRHQHQHHRRRRISLIIFINFSFLFFSTQKARTKAESSKNRVCQQQPKVTDMSVRFRQTTTCFRSVDWQLRSLTRIHMTSVKEKKSPSNSMSSLFFGDSHAAYALIRLNVHSNRLRLIRDVGKWGDGYLCHTTFSLHCHHQNDCIKAGSCVRHFNVSLIVWAKSQEGVHKPQFLKRKEIPSGSNRGPSVYQPSALPLGPTGSGVRMCATSI